MKKLLVLLLIPLLTWGASGRVYTTGSTAINLTSPTDVTQILPAVPLTGGTMTGPLILSGDPTLANQAVNKNYVDSVAGGLLPIDGVAAGSTANLTATYANGTAGVGATLTNTGTLAAFSVDGVTPAINSRILIKDQTSTAQNGVYQLSTVGSGAVAWVLTRTTDYDTAAEIKPGTLVSITSGTVNAGASWYETAVVVTVGTDPINFSSFFSPAGYLQKANNLSDVASPSISRSSLGLGTAATQTTGFFLQTANNLSDVTAATARTNLGLGTAAVQSVAFFNQVANNLSDVPSPSTARSNLGLVIGTNVPSPTGTGASGSWAINAATATLASTVTTNANISGDIATVGNNSVYSGIMPVTLGGLGRANTATLATLLMGNGSTFQPTPYTVPQTIGTSGTILQSDGTNFISSAFTLPASLTTVGRLLYVSASGVISDLATANNSVLSTNGSGVPSLSSTLPSGLTIPGYATTTAALLATNNLNDVPSPSTARSNLGLVIGTNVPAPTGTGASGTWGINVSGNAATATLASTVTTNANLTGGVTSTGNATTVITNANLTGGVTSIGNATTVVTNANLTGDVTSIGNATTYNGIMPLNKGGLNANNAATSGTVPRGNGTAFVPSTFTIPNTFAINEIPYAGSANVLGSVAAANNGVLQTSASGVPSMSTAQTYTPTVGDGTNNFTTSTAQGYYYRVGARTFVNINIIWTGKGSASAGTVFRISLPAAAGAAPTSNTFSIGYIAGVTSTTQIFAFANGTSSSIELLSFVSGGAGSSILVSGVNATGQIQLSGWVGS